MTNTAIKELISIEGTLIEFLPCSHCKTPGSEADARRALDGWHPLPSRCGHCGLIISIQRITLTHRPMMWGKSHVWEVERAILDRSRIFYSNGVDVLVHDECCKIALPHVDWTSLTDRTPP
jgi:hypothetical protein